MQTDRNIIGVCGWKNSGKTTLASNLVREFTLRGFTVATIKHAHHAFDIDQPGTDSYSHREAGASQVVLVSRKRTAFMRELGNSPEPSLTEIIQRLEPCDIVICEGYKQEPIPKLETLSEHSKKQTQIWKSDPNVIGVVSDKPVQDCGLEVFSPHDITPITDFIVKFLRMKQVTNA